MAEVPPAMLARADRECAEYDAAVARMVKRAKETLSSTGDPIRTRGILLAALMTSDDPMKVAMVAATALVRLAEYPEADRG